MSQVLNSATLIHEVPISYTKATIEYKQWMFQTVFTKCIGELGLVQRSSFAVSSLNSLSFDYGDDEDNSNNNKKGFG